MKAAIFTISGLRGVVGQELTPELVALTAGGFGTFCGKGQVAVGRDCRTSSVMVHSALLAGLSGAGCDVLDLGIVPTPTVPLLVRTAKLAGGVMITASHNPPEWNGLKFISRAGAFLTAGEVQELKAVIRRKAFRRAAWDRLGTVAPHPDAVGVHIGRILDSRFFRVRPGPKLKIGIDACHGAASLAAMRMAHELGAQAFGLYCSPDQGGVFPRGPEPTREHLGALGEFVRAHELDFGVAFDPDGDRFSSVDETGNALGEETSVMLATDFVLRQSKGAVAVNLSTTMGVDDVAARYGAPVFRSKVGEAAVVAKMKEVGAIVGGEGNGGVIIPEVNASRDGLVALACLARIVADAGRPLSAIARDLPQYVMVKDKMPSGGRRWPELARRLRQVFPHLAQDTTDGLKLAGSDFWLHVRPSNTEPIVRIIAEARSARRAKELVREAREAVGK